MPEPYRPADRPNASTITNAELAAGIRLETAAVSHALRTWRRSANWPGPRTYPAKAHDAAVTAIAAFDALPAEATWQTLADAVAPLLNAWWPSDGAAAPLADAIERLRWAAINLPALVDNARDPMRPFRPD